VESKEEVILEIAGEGGGITIVGRQNADGSGREFAKKTASDNWLLLEEGETPNPEYKEPPLEWVGSWHEVIALIDQYPWAMLFPLEIHPEFKEDVLAEATLRLSNDHPKYIWTPEDLKKEAMERWLSICR
jgi:hypothetical protein